MPTTYPPPITIPPKPNYPHTHTFILLHGRGSNAGSFSAAFLAACPLPMLFPTAKLIFPTASRRRVGIAVNDIHCNQWFDCGDLNDPRDRPELEVEGLTESGAYLREIVVEEARVLEAAGERDGLRMEKGMGRERIVLVGLSMGCAIALAAMLTVRRRVGAVVGMSGWLPRQVDLEEALGSVEGESKGDRETDRVLRALETVRSEIGAEGGDGAGTSCLDTPVFLGHGTADNTVLLGMGEAARDTLAKMGVNVTWKQYEGWGHWYKTPEEIDDILDFLRGTTNLGGFEVCGGLRKLLEGAGAH